MSQIRTQQSIEQLSSHLESGCEKQTSLIWFVAALAKYLTLFRPAYGFKIVIERSLVLNATRSLTGL